MKVTAYGATDLGMRRPVNEDSFRLCPAVQLFLVADGMGGHAAGHVASRMAVNEVAEFIESHLLGGTDDRDDDSDYTQILVEALQAANQYIITATHHRKDLRGMGTTLVVVLIRGRKLYAASVGDSRLYLIRQEEVKLLTTDHSWVNMQVQLGNMTSEESRLHPMRNVITRALGTQLQVEVDTLVQLLEAGDCLVMCTDGLSNMLSDKEIALSVLHHETDLKQAVEELIQRANMRGGDDNITTVVLKIQDDIESNEHYAQDTEVMFIRPIKPGKNSTEQD
ncbi:Stp1/IreP family PP2C-type Ser/Thr phosphatase [bacterium]|nr:Stp1/IreP family PP2C-type Ser/Thr phosphatase [candidate division CSSED10-310 bacterium]